MKGKYFAVKIGSTFGNLTVLDIRSVLRGKTSPRKEVQVLCRCGFCGSERWYPKFNIVSGKTKSCGCRASKIKHGDWHTRLYGIWRGVKYRCCVPTCKFYKYYGARGIKMCDEWKNDYLAFKEWALANGYSDKLTIDRINPDGDYCPENCRWSTYLTQENNRRNNHYVEYEGMTYTVSQLARKVGIKGSLLNARLRKGELLETAIENVDRRSSEYRRSSTNTRPLKQYVARGESHTMPEWAEILGVPEKKLKSKLWYFMTFEEVVLHVEYQKFKAELTSRPDYTYRDSISFATWREMQKK